MTDWRVWHEQYADEDSSLSRRLTVVQALLTRVVADMEPAKRVLSLCSGDGRDIIPVLARCPPERRPALTLVELDPELAASARKRADDAAVRAEVIVGDAGLRATWDSQLPVELLMLCGIFGNISDDDIQNTISAAPAMLTPTAAVIWTRGAFRDRDVREQVRRWFTAAGLVEVAFESEPGGYGVGLNRMTPRAAVQQVPHRLFVFNR